MLSEGDRDFFVGVTQNGANANLDLAEFGRQLLEFRIMVVAIISASVTVAVAAAFLLTPIYRAEVLLAPANDASAQGGLAALAGQFGGLASIAGMSFGQTSSTDEAVGILKSRQFTYRFISENGLMPILFHDEWDSTKSTWIADDPDDIPTIEDAYELFNEAIRKISADRNNALFTLSIEWRDRQLAADWANQIVDRLNNDVRDNDITEAKNSLAVLRIELENATTVELRQGISRLIETQIETITIANVRNDYVFKILDPAIATDKDKFVRPNRLLLVLGGLSFGILAAMLAAVLRGAATRQVVDQQQETSPSSI